MELVKGNSVSQLWLAAATYLESAKGREDFDVFLNTSSPIALSTEDAKVIAMVDAFLRQHGGLPIETVAETIFPLQDYVRGGKTAVFETYPKRMEKIHAARSDARWGCYAMRILRQKDRDGEVFNPLKALLEKLQKHGKYKATFELAAGQPLESEPPHGDIAIYNAATDRRPLYGNLPCLSHVSIKVDNGRIRLNATYRSHYYIQRLLGNMIGLGRLQYFLAHESGYDVGPLTINSTYAKLDTGHESGNGTWRVADIKELLSNCKKIYTHMEAA